RKLPLTSAVKPAFREQFQEKVISCCSDIRRIVFSSQLFVNSKKDSKEANKDRSIPDVFCQQFWYSVGQLITGKQVTHKTALSEDIKQYYTDFKAKFPTIEVKHKLTVGYSHCLTEAAKELSVSYTNSIVERFEQRLTKFLTYKLRTMLPVRLIVQLYCYQSVCHGHPHWPENLELAAVDKNRIELLCKQFEEFIPGEVTLVSLSAAPAKFVNALWNIQFTYEQEH
ncbi:hypothetical protein BDF20DRAFT_801693, partial [Mycotypha africana]|uniref:uncharacterized protein n=1 Tax=Mycotypha africana TaxID=64632 RepID=UPI002300B131